MTAAGPLALLFGGGQAISGIMAARAQKRAADATADALDMNAAKADLMARDSIFRGEIDSQHLRIQLDSVIGSQKATFAAGNVSINSGTSIIAQEQANELTADEIELTKRNARLQAYGFQLDAEAMRAQAEGTRAAGRDAMVAGVIGAVAGGGATAYTIGKQG